MTIHFTKMHGLGNDFIVIDAIHQQIKLNPLQIAKMANRSTGIGFDQCLLIEPSQNENIDFQYRIFNADGQEVGQCGNGARCIALFAKHYGLTNKNKLTVATKTTHMELVINADDSVSVNMGKPKLSPAQIPLNVPTQLDQYSLRLNDEQIVNFHSIGVGNPHAVLAVPDVDQAPVHALGKQICLHPLFPEQTNVEFMQILNEHHIKLRVYERGCGETIACGSGAVAAAAIGRLFYNLADLISISLLGGDLQVSWPKIDGDIILTGPAAFVYEGKMLP
ncbi:diaminopimelate epimerase [Legionella waltersii]|uniref:Diaminopimelate epimerase n=1 Tax=Legionella waltersii TaxID=66969 RepID=A0A0W1A2G4_9GAMM|nr:diaminopimelate epimerase [Legionella waltersii]KTD75478.1 diaminopimelate epimerase [Legionella waltersii]SNU98192.1 diaminopimelate epimerase [Legionella waltersii]